MANSRGRAISEHNIRKFLGFAIGKRIEDITSGDPKDVPDHDLRDENEVCIHLEGGATIRFVVPDGFYVEKPKRRRKK